MMTEKKVPLAQEAAADRTTEAGGTEPEQRLEPEPERPEKVILGFGHDATAEEMWVAIREELLEGRGHDQGG